MNVDLEDYLEAEVFDQQGGLVGSLNCFWTDDDDHPQFLGIKLKNSPERTSVVPIVLGTADERQSCIKINARSKDIVRAPSLDCDERLEQGFEQKVYIYFGMGPATSHHELHLNRSRAD